MKRVLLLCSVLLCSTTPALAAAPTVSTPTFANLAANQVTITFRSDIAGTGYFVLLPGASATLGTGAQTKAGQDSTGAAAYRFGSLPLAANTNASYTVRNLPANTAYTVAFTADDGTTLQSTCVSAAFTTTGVTALTGFEWAAVGSAGFSAGGVSAPDLALAPDGTPYVAFRHGSVNSYKAGVMKYQGGAWTSVGGVGCTTDRGDDPALAFAPDGTPYVAFTDFNGNPDGRATVMKFSGGTWTTVGVACFSTGRVSRMSLAFAPNGQPWVVYQDWDHSGFGTVMKFTGSAWVLVGTAGAAPSPVTRRAMVFAFDGTPLVAGNNSPSSKAAVAKFNGTDWEDITAGGLSTGVANHICLALSPAGEPHVGYCDGGQSSKVVVNKMIAGTWTQVSDTGPGTASAGMLSLAVAPDATIWVSFKASAYSNATVMKSSGGAWATVGRSRISSGVADYTSLALAPDGTPYVTYGDYANSNADGCRETVMKMTAPAPTLTTPTFTNVGANQVTLRLTCNATGRGYFTLLTGAAATAGTGAQTQAGLDSTGAAAFRSGALPLTANTAGSYTIRNLTANTSYTVCFTADNGATLQLTCATASFTTAAATDLTGGIWVAVQPTRFTPGGGGELTMAFTADGAPSVAFRDLGPDRLSGGQASVMTYNGAAWSFLGSAGFSRSIPNDCNLVISPTGQPYVAYADYSDPPVECNYATVMTYDGTSWVPVGSPRFTVAQAGDVSLAISPTGVPWVAFSEPDNNFKLAVMSFNGTTWGSVGSSLSDGNCGDVKLAFAPDGTPYVAFRDDARSSRASVLKYQGGSWQYVGAAGFTAGTNGAYFLSLAFSPNGTPYLAYADYSNSAKACVMRFDGTSWVNVGAPDFSPSSATYIFLAFGADGQPWIGFRDEISGVFAASVMAFDGTNWVVRGGRGISAGGVAENPLAFAPDGTPYIAFSDSPDGKVSVKRLQIPVTPTVTSVDVPASGTYAPGDYLSFTVHFSTAVTMDGNGTIRLTIGSRSDRFAYYASGTGTSSLVFRYQAQSSDSGAVSIYNAPIFMLYGSIKNSVDNTEATLTLNNPGSTAGVTVGTAVGPTLTTPATANLGANQVTLQLRSNATGTGYFTLLPGAGATAGSGAQVKAGRDSSDAAAFRFGSVALTANTTASYTVGNLVAGTAYTVCFTADDGTTLQQAPVTASFITTTAVDTAALNWAQVGTTLSAAAGDYDALAFAPDGTPYVAFQDYDIARKLTVKRFDGTNWVTVGTAGFSDGAADFIALAISPSGTPYVAYKDDGHSYKATVMQFTSGAWSVVGTAGFSAGQACDHSLAFAPNGTPFLAYRDVANGQKATVVKFDGSTWAAVGSAGVTPNTAYNVSLAFSPAGQPYIAYRDESSGGKASVMKFDGTAWANVGSAGFSADTAYPSRLVFAPDGTPYLAFQDVGHAQRATVMKYTSGAWSNVGAAGFTSAAASNLSLAFGADGAPQVAFTDAAVTSKATVMKFNGTGWVTVGTTGFSTGSAGFPSLAFAPNGRPWIAYKDNGNSGKATVMSLSAAAAATTPTITWAAPAAITYGTALSSTQLNATATAGATPVAGTFAYTPAAGTTLNAGTNQTLSVTFTPTDTTAYTSATATTTITVNKATATVSLSGLSATYNGSPRAAVVTTVPSGVSTSVTYDGNATVPTNAGSYAIVATVTSTNYTGTASGTLVIGKADQTITFDVLGSRTVGDPAFTLAGTASSTLPVTYTSSILAVATVSGATVSVVGAGSTNITASQAGNPNYNAATAVVRLLTVAAQPPIMPVARPFIYASPVSQIAAEGDTVKLAAGVSGLALSYQWRKDGTDIPGAQSGTLTLTTITPAGAGSYTLAVTNSAGTAVSAPAMISVTAKAVAPTITTQPRSQTVGYGSTLTLGVTAAGSAPLGYQWYKNGAPISGATLATLTMSPAAPKSAGEYTVAVANAAGSVRSNAAVVAVGPRGLLRAYLGTFAGTSGTASRGTFALYLRDDGTGVFLAYESASRFAYVVRSMQVDAARRFHFSMIPANPGGVWRAASGATVGGETVVDAAIGPDGSISGTLSGGVSATLSAPEPAITPAPADLAGFYEAGIAGTSAAGYFIVNDSLQTFVVTVNGPEGDAATGTVAASGAFSLTTENRAGIQGTISCEAATLTSKITVASGESVTCVGGNKDTRKAVERMINVSGRGMVTAADPLISGFIVTGSEPKRVLIRAVGPTLAGLGVRTALSAARLEVFQGAKSIAVGSDWSSAANAAEVATTAAVVGAFPLAANSHDAALVLTLAPGSYTAVVTGQAGATGVALAEVYDASPASAGATERVVNISSRANVGAADATLFSGFVVSGTVPKRVLIRGAGASLTQFGAKNALTQPVLTLWSGQTVVTRNSDWTASAESAAVAAASAEVGAFPLSSSGGDAALLIYLQPGAYCVQISGRDGATGVAVAEVYELP